MNSPSEPAVKRPATYADLEALPPHIKGEVIDGVLYTSPWPRARHANRKSGIASALHAPYQQGRGGPGGWWIIIEPGIEHPRSPEFSPDVAGWRRERLPEFPGEDEPFRLAPDWICEILSPSTRSYDMVVKRRFYAEIGVGWLWYVDPDARSLTVSRLQEGHWLEIAVYGGDAKVRAEPFPAVELDLGVFW